MAEFRGEVLIGNIVRVGKEIICAVKTGRFCVLIMDIAPRITGAKHGRVFWSFPNLLEFRRIFLRRYHGLLRIRKRIEALKGTTG